MSSSSSKMTNIWLRRWAHTNTHLRFRFCTTQFPNFHIPEDFYTNIVFVSLIRLGKAKQNMQAGDRECTVMFWKTQIFEFSFRVRWLYNSLHCCYSPKQNMMLFIQIVTSFASGQNTHDDASRSIELIRRKLALAQLRSIFEQQGAWEADLFKKRPIWKEDS